MFFRFTNFKSMVAVVATTLLLSGCGGGAAVDSTASSTTASAGGTPSPEGAKLLLASEPTESKSVIDARESVKDGEPVVLMGRIGGSMEPWVEGRAAFQIVDTSLTPCSEKPGDSCTTPWDYCCDTDRLPTSMATIKFVDEQGQTVSSDARKMFGVSELQTVVVQGLAKRDEAGNLTVLAEKLFIRPGTGATHHTGESHGHAGHDHHDHEAEHNRPADLKDAPATQPSSELP